MFFSFFLFWLYYYYYFSFFLVLCLSPPSFLFFLALALPPTPKGKKKKQKKEAKNQKKEKEKKNKNPPPRAQPGPSPCPRPGGSFNKRKEKGRQETDNGKEREKGKKSHNNNRKKQLLRLQSKFFASLLGTQTHHSLSAKLRGGAPPRAPLPALPPPRAPRRPRSAQEPPRRRPPPDRPSGGDEKDLKRQGLYFLRVRALISLCLGKSCASAVNANAEVPGWREEEEKGKGTEGSGLAHARCSWGRENNKVLGSGSNSAARGLRGPQLLTSSPPPPVCAKSGAALLWKGETSPHTPLYFPLPQKCTTQVEEEGRVASPPGGVSRN